MWILAQLISSTYAYVWDIKMDWGLLDKNAGENTFLREEIVYSSTVSGVFTYRPHKCNCCNYRSSSTILP